jgi:hypothetical protein
MIWRIAGALVLLVLVIAIAQRLFVHPSAAPGPAVTRAIAAAAAPPGPPPAGCQTDPAFAAASGANAATSANAPWSVFGRPENGWQIYVPLVAREIGVACPPSSEGFAAALAGWQRSHGVAASGAMDEATLRAFDLAWLGRRPFVAASSHGQCPSPPLPTNLVAVAPNEGYLGQPALLRPGTLAAYRRMVAAARAESPAIAADPKLLTIFSGYRDPAADAAACAARHDCGTPAHAGTCSAHRTGLAMDIYLGSAPGYPPESSDDANRLYESRTPAYLWLVANAGRFGFVNYAFEPWHWEWTGEPP